MSLLTHVSKAGVGTSGAIDTTGATVLVGLVTRTNVTASTFSDSKSNKWALIKSEGVGSAGAAVDLYLAYPSIDGIGSGHTFTVASGFPCLYVAAFSQSQLLDIASVKSANNSSANSIQPGSMTPAQDNSVIIACMSYRDTTTISVDGGFTIIDQQPFLASNYIGGALAYLIQTSAAASNPTFSWTNAQNCTSAQIAIALAASTGSGGGGSYASFG